MGAKVEDEPDETQDTTGNKAKVHETIPNEHERDHRLTRRPSSPKWMSNRRHKKTPVKKARVIQMN